MAVKSWDRLKKEGEKAYFAFTCYLNLPHDKCNLKSAEKIYRQHYNMNTKQLEKTGTASATINQWSTKHKWVNRRGDYWSDIAKKAALKNEKKRIKEISEAKESFRKTARISQGLAELAGGITHIELKKRLIAVNNNTSELEMKDLLGLINSTGKASKSALDTWQILEPDDFTPKQKVELSWAEQLALDNEVDPQKFLDDMDALLLMSLEDDEDS